MADLRHLAFGGVEPVSRADFRQVLLRLCEPFSEPSGFAGLLDATSHPGAVFAPRVARLELLSRLLWGLAPLAAGGGQSAVWPLIRTEITAGTDPDDPGYWGRPTDIDQRIVESAALGLAVALAPGEMWEPLTPAQRDRFAHWLRSAASAKAVENNWRLFATLVNLGLASVGEAHDPAITLAAFERISEFHHGAGWYADGEPGQPFDYYNPWAIHFYSLINAARGAVDGTTEAWIRERARAFATEFARWFAPDGAALPFGRSLTYRFAQSSYFGALALAGETGDGLSWGQLRGLWARNLRWWGRQPVLNGDGTLSIGYGYPNPLMSESYNAPGSPYWAFKAFLPLALPAEHPFWTAEEEPYPAGREPVHAQPRAGFLLQRDRRGQVTALSAASGGRWTRHGEAKYGKFAYSTAFAFSVPSRAVELEGAGGDSMLMLSEDGRHWRAREENDETWPVEGSGVLARWSPWPDVHIESLLLPFGSEGRWHVRAHRIETERELWTAESGFCVPLDSDVTGGSDSTNGAGGTAGGAQEQCAAFAVNSEAALCAGIRDLTGTRRGVVLRPDPNTHLLWPRTLLPTVRGRLEPGLHWLVTGVYADTDGDATGFGDGAPSWRQLDGLGLPPEAVAKVSQGSAT